MVQKTKMSEEHSFTVSKLKEEYDNKLLEFISIFKETLENERRVKEYLIREFRLKDYVIDSTLPKSFNECMLVNLDSVLNDIIIKDNESYLKVYFTENKTLNSSSKELKVVFDDVLGEFELDKCSGVWKITSQAYEKDLVSELYTDGDVLRMKSSEEVINLSRINNVEYVIKDTFAWENFFKGFITHVASTFDSKVMDRNQFYNYMVSKIWETTISLARYYMSNLKVTITLRDNLDNVFILSRGILDNDNDGDVGSLHLPLYIITDSIENTLGCIKPWCNRESSSLSLSPFTTFNNLDVSSIISSDGRIINNVLNGDGMSKIIPVELFSLCEMKYKLLKNK